MPNFHGNLVSQVCFRIALKGQSPYERPSALTPKAPSFTPSPPLLRTEYARFGVPTEAAEMAEYYVLNAENPALVRAKRLLNNRLGFAIQLCSIRHSGRPIEPSGVPPTAMLSFVAMMLGDRRVSLPRRGRCPSTEGTIVASQLPGIRGMLDEGATRVFADGYENIRLRSYTKCSIKRARNAARPGCKVVR